MPGTLSAAPKSSGGGINLRWTTSTGHDGYRILHHEGSRDLNFLKANGSVANVTNTSKISQAMNSYQIDDFVSFVIVAYNSAVESVYSNVVEEEGIPRTPNTQTPDVSRPGKVTLNWLVNTGVNSFKIYRE